METVRHILELCGVNASDEQIQKIEKYVQSLRDYNARIHLISKKDVSFIEQRHVLVSVLYVRYLLELGNSAVKKILDLGSGGGLPGVVMAILMPDVEFVLLDSSRKKTLFLERVKESLELDYQVLCKRMEEVEKSFLERIDCVVARAVAPMDKLIELCEPVLQAGRCLITVKGSNFKEEFKEKNIEMFQVRTKGLVELVGRSVPYLRDKFFVEVKAIDG